MTIMYIDKFSQAMKMEVSEDDYNEIHIPVLLRNYKTFDSFSIFFNPTERDRTKMQNNLLKKSDEMEYFLTELICKAEPDNMNNWYLDKLEQAPDTIIARLDHYWEGYFTNWFNKYCKVTRLLTEGRLNLGETLYLTNVTVSDYSNASIHLYGRGVICKDVLSNVLLFIHGNYVEV